MIVSKQTTGNTNSADRLIITSQFTHSNHSIATRLDTPNTDSTETTRIHSNPTMKFQTYTQNKPNQHQNTCTQSWGSDDE
jgi:hypothetical protein